MKRSRERILTTHVGSLARPQDLVRLMWDLQDGKEVDPEVLERRSQEAISEAVDRQRRIGIDVVNDGEIPDDIVRNAPETQSHFFLVPKVVE